SILLGSGTDGALGLRAKLMVSNDVQQFSPGFSVLREGRPMRRRATALLALALLGATGASGEESSSGSTSDSYVPRIGVPDAAGGARAGGSGNAGAHPGVETKPGQAPEMYVPDEDLPGWLGRTTGLWKAPSAPDPTQRRHMALAPFITTSPLMGVGFGVAA